jgi:hypothetical protein
MFGGSDWTRSTVDRLAWRFPLSEMDDERHAAAVY